jgi:hypothetical protein
MQFPKPRRGVLVPRKQTVRKLRGISHNDRIARKGGKFGTAWIFVFELYLQRIEEKNQAFDSPKTSEQDSKPAIMLANSVLPLFRPTFADFH